MPGRYLNSPSLVGKSYADVADYPNDRPITSDGKRLVYMGIRKVYLVIDGIIADFYDWEIYGSQGRSAQRQAQEAWGMNWLI